MTYNIKQSDHLWKHHFFSSQHLKLETQVPCVDLQRVSQILLSPEAFSLSTRDQECSRACTEESPRTDVWNRESKGITPNKSGFTNQVIQAATFSSPNVGSHQQPLKGPLNHPKKVTAWITRKAIFLWGGNVWHWGGGTFALKFPWCGGSFWGEMCGFFFGWKKSPPGNSAFSWPFWQWWVSENVTPLGKVGIVKETQLTWGSSQVTLLEWPWMIIINVTTTIITRWWFQIFFIFIPIWGRWTHFD